MSVKLHMVRKYTGAWGANVTTSLCGRVRTMSDGMNLTDERRKVTCSFCRRVLDREKAHARMGVTCTRSRCTVHSVAGRP